MGLNKTEITLSVQNLLEEYNYDKENPSGILIIPQWESWEIIISFYYKGKLIDKQVKNYSKSTYQELKAICRILKAIVNEEL